MSAIRDRTMAVESSLAALAQYFPSIWSALLSDVPAHPICFRAIDGYVPVFQLTVVEGTKKIKRDRKDIN